MSVASSTPSWAPSCHRLRSSSGVGSSPAFPSILAKTSDDIRNLVRLRISCHICTDSVDSFETMSTTEQSLDACNNFARLSASIDLVMLRNIASRAPNLDTASASRPSPRSCMMSPRRRPNSSSLKFIYSDDSSSTITSSGILIVWLNIVIRYLYLHRTHLCNAPSVKPHVRGGPESADSDGVWLEHRVYRIHALLNVIPVYWCFGRSVLFREFVCLI